MLRIRGSLSARGVQLGRVHGTVLRRPCNVSHRKPIQLQLKSHNSTSGPGTQSVSAAGAALKYAVALVGGVATAGGMATIYANYDRDFRARLEDSVPYASEMFNSIYGELVLTPEELMRIGARPSDDSMLQRRTPRLKDKVESNKASPRSEPAGETTKPSSSSFVAVSSVDQSSVSLVDLDISNSSPKHAAHKKGDNDNAAVINDKVAVAGDDDVVPPETAGTAVMKDTAEDAPPVMDDVQRVTVEPARDDTALPTDKSSTSTDDNLSSTSTGTVATTPSTEEVFAVEELSREDAVSDLDTSDRPSLETLLHASSDHLRLMSDRAMRCQKEAALSIRAYGEQLSRALATANSDADYDAVWLSAAALEHESQAKIDEAKSAESRVAEEVNKLEHVIRAVRKSGSSDVADEASNLGGRVYLDLAKSAEEVHAASSELAQMNTFHELVGHAEAQFEREVSHIAPEIKRLIADAVADSGSDETKGATASRALLAYALKKSELLMSQLEQQKAAEKTRLQQMLTAQREDSETRLSSVLDTRTQALQKEAASERERLEAKLLSKYEAEIRRQLKRQAAAHRDHLSDVVRVQAEELAKKHNDESGRLLQDQEMDHLHVSGQLLARLEAILSSVDLLNDIECRHRKAQELMLAVQSLSVAMGDDIEDGHSRCLLPEIVAINRLSDHDGEIGTALGTIPAHAAQQGVVTEERLRERFDKVHTVCRRVAMVGEDGGSMWTYGLSWMRSWLTFDVNTSVHINEAIDVDDIDTYAILAKARCSVKAGDWEQAVKFMSLLRGLPRQLASDWMEDATSYLETKQATDYLMAHSMSLGLGAVPLQLE